jgi:predicted nucleic acid-binding protein
MKDRFLIDTNIIVYIFDRKNIDKQKISVNILEKALEKMEAVVSFQVIQEFCNVALKKFEILLSISDCKYFINKFLFPICEIFPGLDLYNKAIEIKEITNYGFYDCLIIASAVYGKCNILYSEDLNAGEEIMGIKIVNPYAKS